MAETPLNPQPLPQIQFSYYWLSAGDLMTWIGHVPDTFNYQEKLGPYIFRVVTGWLTELIGSDRVIIIDNEIRGSSNQSETTQNWMTAITPFLANAVWSLYIMQANVNYTATGAVQKVNDGQVEQISEQQRATLSKYYRNEAERFALKLSKMAAGPDSCGPNVKSGRPTIRSVGGRRKSRFE